MDLNLNLALNMKLVRIRRGETLDVFSESAGISRSTLQEIEANRANVTLNTLDTIARHLAMHPFGLLSEQLDTLGAVRALLSGLDRFLDLDPNHQALAVSFLSDFLRVMGGEDV